MSPTPRLLLSLVLMPSAGLGLALVVVGWSWARLRSQSRALACVVAELTERVAALEASRAADGAGREPRKAWTEAPVRTHPVPPSFRAGGPVYRVDDPEPNAVSGPTLITVPSLAASSAPPAPEASLELGRRFGTIWSLADEGASPEMIARRTGQPIGQVELILALRRQSAAQGGSRT